MTQSLVQQIRKLAIELGARGTRPGFVGAGTKTRAEEIRRQLLALHAAEKKWKLKKNFKKSEEYKVLPNGTRLSRLIPDNDRKPVRLPLPNNAKGEILERMLEHVVVAIWGRGSMSPEQKEQAIVAAAQALPTLCEQLQALDDQQSEHDSVEKQTIEQTIEQTIPAAEQTKVGQNSGKPKKPWTPLAADLKKRWFTEMRKRKQWIHRKQFIAEFLASSDGTRDKWAGLKANTEDRRFQDNKAEWKAESEAIKTQFENRR